MIKIQKFHYVNKICDTRKKRWDGKIICLNDVYKFSVGNFLTRCIFYVLILNIGN